MWLGVGGGLMVFSVCVALLGVYVAYIMYIRRTELPGRLASRLPVAYKASYNKMYMDEVYAVAPIRATIDLSVWLWQVVDAKIIDGAVNGVAKVWGWVGTGLRPIQTGKVQNYAMYVFGGILILTSAKMAFDKEDAEKLAAKVRKGQFDMDDLLNQLRQPLEEGEVWICRTRARLRFPCAVTLVAATNPCPCGWYGDPERACICGEAQRQRYWGKLSGPLLDRLDLQVILRRPDVQELGPDRQTGSQPRSPGSGEASRSSGSSGAPGSTAQVAERVCQARQHMAARNPRGCANSSLSSRDLAECGHFAAEALQLWRSALQHRALSARAGERVLRIARTIADLAGDSNVDGQAIAEALTYRSFDRDPQACPKGAP